MRRLLTVQDSGEETGRSARLILAHLPSALVTLLLLPIAARRYFRASTGRAYGVGLGTVSVFRQRLAELGYTPA